MADFPSPDVSPSLPVLGIGQIADMVNPGIPASANWAAANQAAYFPIRLRTPYLLASMYVLFGSITSTKNWDIGFYDKYGTRLWNNGSFAGTSDTFITKTLGTPILLSPGTYFMALASSSATSNGVVRRAPARSGMLNLTAIYQQGTAFPLPATATFAAVTNVIIPVMGIARITTY